MELWNRFSLGCIDFLIQIGCNIFTFKEILTDRQHLILLLIIIAYQLLLYFYSKFTPSMQSDEYSQQESAFELVNDILSNGKKADQAQQIDQLRSLCGQLIATNRQLNEQLELLRQELQAKSSAPNQTSQSRDFSHFNDEYTQMNVDFIDIEDYLASYRSELAHYQQKVNHNIKDKSALIDRLKEEIYHLQKNQDRQNSKIINLQNQRAVLEETKDNLLSEIEQLQSSIKNLRFETPRSLRKSINQEYANYEQEQIDGNFNANIEQELQKLIEKLIKQLEHERSIKKKMLEENRRLQETIVGLQKQIVNKNKKIYELEIDLIKNNKKNSPAQVKHSPKQPSPLLKNMKNFTFMQLINDQIEINSKEKLIVAVKTIDFYIKQIQNRNFTSHILESIKICNYNNINPNLIMIRVSKSFNILPADYDQTEAGVIWNLAFVLDSLFNQSIDRDKDFGGSQHERDIIDFLNQILENRQGNVVSTVFQLRRMMEEGIALRK